MLQNNTYYWNYSITSYTLLNLLCMHQHYWYYHTHNLFIINICESWLLDKILQLILSLILSYLFIKLFYSWKFKTFVFDITIFRLYVIFWNIYMLLKFVCITLCINWFYFYSLLLAWFKFNIIPRNNVQCSPLKYNVPCLVQSLQR